MTLQSKTSLRPPQAVRSRDASTPGAQAACLAR